MPQNAKFTITDLKDPYKGSFFFMSDFVVWFLNNPYTLGVLCFLLVMVPIIGIWVVHSTDKK